MDIRRGGAEMVGEGGGGSAAERFDCYGAMDLSSSCSSDREDREEATRTVDSRKRKAEKDLLTSASKKDRTEPMYSGKGLPLKVRNKRRNIKAVMAETELVADTVTAQAEEQRRLARLAAQNILRIAKV